MSKIGLEELSGSLEARQFGRRAHVVPAADVVLARDAARACCRVEPREEARPNGFESRKQARRKDPHVRVRVALAGVGRDETVDQTHVTTRMKRGVVDQHQVRVGNARSQFTPRDLKDEVATNDVSGDTIIINFRESEVKRVKVMGNAVGSYRFARIAAMLEMLGTQAKSKAGEPGRARITVRLGGEERR